MAQVIPKGLVVLKLIIIDCMVLSSWLLLILCLWVVGTIKIFQSVVLTHYEISCTQRETDFNTVYTEEN